MEAKLQGLTSFTNTYDLTVQKDLNMSSSLLGFTVHTTLNNRNGSIKCLTKLGIVGGKTSCIPLEER